LNFELKNTLSPSPVIENLKMPCSKPIPLKCETDDETVARVGHPSQRFQVSGVGFQGKTNFEF
jgi:hypothetical protein